MGLQLGIHGYPVCKLESNIFKGEKSMDVFEYASHKKLNNYTLVNNKA